MTSIGLLNKKFHIEILDRKDRHYEIVYHESIIKDANAFDRIQPYLEASYDLFHAIHLPIALKTHEGKKYKLIARYWTLQYLINHHDTISRFPAIIFEDEKLVPEVLELEKLENDYFLRKETAPDVSRMRTVKSKSKIGRKKQPDSKFRSTARRRTAKSTGRKCPFCPGPLVKSIGKYNEPQGDLLSQDGPHRISCGYKKNKRYNCSFFATLTNAEYGDFINKDMSYPTTTWIELAPDKICPDCGGKVYTRTRRNLDGTIQEQDRCRKLHQSKDNTCFWTSPRRSPKKR